MDNKKCVVLVPVARTIEFECEQGLQELHRRGYHIRFMRGGSQVDLVRSAMATRAIDDGFEETLWIDSDIGFNPDDVEKLRASGEWLIAGLYMKRGPKEFAGKFANVGPVMFGTGGGIIPMQYLGMGFTLVRAAVYQAIQSRFMLPRCGGNYDPTLKIVPYFIPTLAKNGDGMDYLSEDSSFCHRASACGVTPKADTTIKLKHIGSYAYTWDHFAEPEPMSSLEIHVQQPRIVSPP